MTLPRRAAVYAEAVAAGLETTATMPPLDPDIDAFHVLGLIDRESECGLSSGLDQKGPAGIGDNGNGYGLGQFDKNPHPDSYVDENGLTNDQWIAASDDWKDPQKNITRVCAQLRWGIQYLQPACPNPAWALVASIAAYNAGPPHVKRILAGLDASCSIEFVVSALDVITTGHDYVTDVLGRRQKFMS